MKNKYWISKYMFYCKGMIILFISFVLIIRFISLLSKLCVVKQLSIDED